jgi:hypothetical protein
MKFERLTPLVPVTLMNKSGEVFYSGRAAFERQSPVYLLGLNPGSDSSDATLNTVESSLHQTSEKHSERFSRYLDERWNRANGGYTPMQIRVKHLFYRLGLDLRDTPASNLVFPRSPDASSIGVGFDALAEQCWPLHREIISSQGVKVVICMGEKTFDQVSLRLGAKQYVADYVERNQRGWRCIAHRNSGGVSVIRLTHPSRANWTNPLSDPSPLVRHCLDEIS